MQFEADLYVLSTELTRFRAIEIFFDSLMARDLKLNVYPCEDGLEIHFLNEINGMPNRAHLRIYFPMETKCVLFFHKKSSIPFSRDRFSYGGVVIDCRSSNRFTKSEVEEWIEFLINGLNPKLRPSTVKKGLPYTIPEN